MGSTPTAMVLIYPRLLLPRRRESRQVKTKITSRMLLCFVLFKCFLAQADLQLSYIAKDILKLLSLFFLLFLLLPPPHLPGTRITDVHRHTSFMWSLDRTLVLCVRYILCPLSYTLNPVVCLKKSPWQATGSKSPQDTKWILKNKTEQETGTTGASAGRLNPK